MGILILFLFFEVNLSWKCEIQFKNPVKNSMKHIFPGFQELNLLEGEKESKEFE